MKYLLVLAVVLIVIWLVRSGRRDDEPRKDAPGRRTPGGRAQDMVECPVCKVHLPRTDALPGPDGRLYCCAEHRMRAGD